MSKIVPHLWYTDKAVEAANFYVALFPNSKIDHIDPILTDTPSGPAGSVDVVEFTLMGQTFMAISAGPLDDFNHSVSFLVNCDTQAEIDKYWDVLSKDGKIEQCGWVRDRYGLCWQISYAGLGKMIRDTDKTRAKRVTEAMMHMVKIESRV